MDYFKFYDLPISFNIDALKLKRKYYANSKKYHPDFYTLESEEEQSKMLQLSTFNNKAYQVLSNPDERMKYILELKGLLAKDIKNALPPEFLMEMMTFNEGMMDLEMGFDPDAFKDLKNQINAYDNNLMAYIQPTLNTYQDSSISSGELLEIKKYYLKRRYLLRIQEKITKFALS